MSTTAFGFECGSVAPQGEKVLVFPFWISGTLNVHRLPFPGLASQMLVCIDTYIDHSMFFEIVSQTLAFSG